VSTNALIVFAAVLLMWKTNLLVMLSAPHYAIVLGLDLGVACAMHHLHAEGALHGDFKVWSCVEPQPLPVLD
jgi:hypothetical protein